MRYALICIAFLVLPLQPALAESMRLAHSFSEQSVGAEIATHFADEARSLGSLEIEVFGNRQLGRSRDYASMLRTGEIELAILRPSDLYRISEMEIFDLPFLIRDRDHDGET